MKTTLLDIQGKEKGKIDLPNCFSKEIREDIVLKVLETKKHKQPYAPSLVAGKQHSASGKMRHRRHVWQTHYGRGMSRIPRKVMSRRGTQFNWVGAEVCHTVGGRRAHPPKILSMINTKQINKKEEKIALISSLSATTRSDIISKRYSTLENKKIGNLPFIVEDKLISLKVKDIILSLKKILGQDLFNVAIKKKSVRGGVGKMRGRKYKRNLGVLIVIGKNEKIRTKIFDVVDSSKVGVADLAKGGVGRLTIYTEEAIKDLGEKYK